MFWGKSGYGSHATWRRTRFLPQGYTRPYTEGAEAITTKGEYIGDWIGMPEIFIIHLIYDNLLWYIVLIIDIWSCGTLYSLFIEWPCIGIDLARTPLLEVKVKWKSKCITFK